MLLLILLMMLNFTVIPMFEYLGVFDVDEVGLVAHIWVLLEGML